MSAPTPNSTSETSALAQARIAKDDTLAFDNRIGKATARRTYLRTIGEQDDSPLYESRVDLSDRVALGNSLLHPTGKADYEPLYHAIRTGKLLTAGRHLQQGDENQPNKVQELFTNCSVSPMTNTLFLLLLNGSGVGRSYDDSFIYTDWRAAPEVIIAIDRDHADWGNTVMGCPWNDKQGTEFVTPEHAHNLALQRRTLTDGKIITHRVHDSREGWAKAIELYENTTYLRSLNNEDTIGIIVFDFSDVRAEGTPIGGMQGRPASGPVPMMHAIREIDKLRTNQKYQDWSPWKTTLAADHELASVVAVGGARRAARMATKRWDDPEITQFVEFKRANKHDNGKVKYNSANQSVVVDQEFWSYVEEVFGPDGIFDIKDRIQMTETEWGPWATGYKPVTLDEIINHTDSWLSFQNHQYANPERALHAANVFLAVTFCSYYDGTGEPGFINGDHLDQNPDGIDQLIAAVDQGRVNDIVGYDQGEGYHLSEDSAAMFVRVLRAAQDSSFPTIVNPCGEIPLTVWGAYCVIGDIGFGNFVKSYTHVEQRPLGEVREELLEVARLTTRFLMRVNTMPCLWKGEVKRTNRIGVGLTGIHEFALGQFGLNFYELIGDYQESTRAAQFWNLLEEVSQEIQREAARYARVLGVTVPHTSTTIKPSGTVSKLDNLTEGCHLPAKLRYLRNVQFQTGDPLVKHYAEEDYPVAELKSAEYKGVHVVGFPTKPFIVDLAERLGLEDELTIAPEVNPEDQYTWLQKLEKHWITGGNTHKGGQVSYTLKYDASKTDYQHFATMMLQYQPNVRCCSVMPEFPLNIMPNPYDVVQNFIVRFRGEEEAQLVEEAPFEYVPEQILSPDVFDAVEALIHRDEDDIEDIGYEHLDCDGGACPIEFNEVI